MITFAISSFAARYFFIDTGHHVKLTQPLTEIHQVIHTPFEGFLAKQINVYLKGVNVSSTMGPGINIDASAVQ